MIRKKKRHDHTHESHELFWLYLQSQETTKELKKINTKLNKIMGLIEDLTARADGLDEKVVELQASVDSKQDALIAAFAELKAQIAALQAIIDAGTAATPEQLQVVLNKLQATSDKIDVAKTDVDSTPTA